MLIPAISLLLGITLIIIASLVFKGQYLVKHSPFIARFKGNSGVAVGSSLIAIALMLGVIGYLGYLNADSLRQLRIVLGLSGLAILVTSVLEVPQRLNFLRLEFYLNVFAALLVGALLIKCLIFVDQNGDTWMYQLPYAARLWGIITEKEYIFEYEREHIYQGFPLLANFLQGLFWKLFGLENPQGANLVSFLSLITYFVFLRSYLKIPLYLSAIALLAVPLIHIAATAGYVDLFGNIWLAIAIIMTYLLYVRDNFLTWKNILILVLASAGAANTKFLLVPPLFIVLFLAVLRILYLAWLKREHFIKNVVKIIAISALSSIIIFATEVKNLVVFGNPFYPLRVAIAGMVLNHAIVPSSDYMSPKLQAMFPYQRWLYSLLEIGAFSDRRPWPWTIAMDFVPLEDDTFGMGGYFAFYVVFNVILFIFLCWQTRQYRETKGAIATVILITVLTPLLPFAYQLRYYFYWFIVFITLNLYLLLLYQQLPSPFKWIEQRTFGLVAVAVIMVFCIQTRWDYTKPRNNPLSAYLDHATKPEVLQQIQDDDKVCLVGFAPHTFLYNAKFHSPRTYNVKSEYNDITYCGSRKIIENKTRS